MLLSVAAGAVTGILTQLWGVPLHFSVLMCILATGATEVLRAALYVPSIVKKGETNLVDRRLTVLGLAFALATVLATVILRVGKEPERAEEALGLAEQEAKAGRIDEATEHLQRSTRLLETAASRRTNVPQSFFQNSVQTLDQLKSSGVNGADIQKALVKLATYRSALNPKPPLPKQTAVLPVNDFAFVVVPGVLNRSFTSVNLNPWGLPYGGRVIGGSVAIDCTGIKPGQEIFANPAHSVEKPETIEGFILIGATQTLDWIYWDGTTFVSTQIKYLGGPVRLRNVRFVNCTFDFPTDNFGQQLAKYAALEPKQELRIPG